MPDLQIDTDPRRLDLEMIHAFLSTSYWAAGIPRDVLQRSIDNSLCFGGYLADAQVAFARVITDRATFAYLADVFVIPEHRGRGLSKQLLAAAMAHPDLQSLRRWMLVTRDMQALYAPFGFRALAAPERVMERHRPDIYRDIAAAAE